MHPCSYGLLCGGTATATAGHEQQVCFATVGTHHRRQQTVGVGAIAQNRSAGSISKQDASVTILPIDNGRQLFSSHHQNRIVSARHDELLCHFESINEPRTSCFQVKCGGTVS